MRSQAAVVTPLISANFTRDEGQLQLLFTDEKNLLKLRPLNTHFLSKLPNSPSAAGLEDGAPSSSQSQH